MKPGCLVRALQSVVGASTVRFHKVGWNLWAHAEAGKPAEICGHFRADELALVISGTLDSGFSRIISSSGEIGWISDIFLERFE